MVWNDSERGESTAVRPLEIVPRLTEYTELQQLRNNDHQATAGTRREGGALLPICVLSFLNSGLLGWV